MHAARGKAALRGGLSWLRAILVKEAEGQRGRETGVGGGRRRKTGTVGRAGEGQKSKDTERLRKKGDGGKGRPTETHPERTL